MLHSLIVQLSSCRYFLLVVGAVPRCSSTSAILDAPSFTDAVLAFASAAGDALQHIFLESYVSLGACIGLFLALMALAKAGGFGIVEQDPGNERSRKSNPGYAETYKMRSGGIATQARCFFLWFHALLCDFLDGRPGHTSINTGGHLEFLSVGQALVALVHTSVHLSMAIGLMIALDLGIETCIRYGDLGAEGYHGLYNWYRAFEAQHFPDPNNVRGKLETFTLHLYPACLKWLMSLFDLPEAVALGRATMCSSGYNSLNRLESLGYYLGMLAYYWVLATPAIAAIFGCYLYVCVCWFHVHFDEGFSSLRIPHHKGFLRLHISKEGKLHIWALAIDQVCALLAQEAHSAGFDMFPLAWQVPEHWTEDPRWHGFLGGADKRSPSYKAKYPSRWQPDTSLADRSTSEVQVVDHLVVSKKTPLVDQTLKSPCIAPLNLGQCWGDLRI